jgi:hypothetical protein
MTCSAVQTLGSVSQPFQLQVPVKNKFSALILVEKSDYIEQWFSTFFGWRHTSHQENFSGTPKTRKI